ncbi:zinc finger CCCH domain-containing protein 18-like isoform X1 [Pezoporus flaviventris]|uniref:zinc finger CCCH domain-containing protein 18-like isoform X1 n=1 Tax=Pezoporus flaviventris TaxID=889875 RepID=UPI002AB29036|nr:zinc finger CCCH domain-containing protein 18-like isoform X1 [Pezoporus flaviventris]
MDVSDSPERNPCSPDEEDQQHSNDEVLKESYSDRELDGEGGQGSIMGEEEDAARGLSRGEVENHSDEEDLLSETKSQESDNNKQSGELKSPLPCKGEEEDQTNDLGDEASSVTRELDEHELDYDEEVLEEPSAAAVEEDGEKAAGEDDKEEEKGDDAHEDEKKSSSKSDDGKDGQDPLKEKKKDDDGEIDDGEIDDDDLEEGEVKDPSDRKVRPRPTCRFFMKGHCTWGMNCRFIHPGVNDKGNYSLISKPEPFSPNGAPPIGPHPLMPANPWGGPVVDEILPPPPPEPPTESAWERGLRHAKEVLKKATIRKEQEPDFEEKRFTVTIGEDEREFDKENEFFHDWNYCITRDVRDPALDPYTDSYYDYEIERFRRGGQYENFRIQYADPDPYRNHRERERERERENRQRERERERERERRQRERERERERERDKERQRRKEEWERERERVKRDEKDRQHRDRDRDREKEKEKTKPRSLLIPSRQPETPKKEKETATLTTTQSKRADEWKDPWRRSKSPKKKLGVSVSPSHVHRCRKTSASSASASGSSRSSSRSSTYSGSGSSRSRSRSSSYSSYSSRSSRHSSFSGSRSRSRSFSSSPSPSPTPSPHKPLAKSKGVLLPPAGKGEKSVKKLAALPVPQPLTKITTAAPESAKPGDNPEARRKERQTRTPPRRQTISSSISGSASSYSGSSSQSRSLSQSLSRSHSRSSSASVSHSPSGSRKSRSLSMSSVSSVSSASSSSSSVSSADSEDMYADLASPVSSASSQSPTPAQQKKGRGKSKKEDSTKEEKQKRDVPAQLLKSAKPTQGSKSQQLLQTQEPSAPQSQQGGFSTHKEIKLTLLNKASDKGSRKRYEPADKNRPTSPPAKRVNLSPDRVGSRDRKATGRLSSPKEERQRGQNPKPSPMQTDRKRQLSPQSKSSSKVTSIPGKASEPGPMGAKAGKSSTLSRREELLKQLKAVEDAIARKRAKIPGKV